MKTGNSAFAHKSRSRSSFGHTKTRLKARTPFSRTYHIYQGRTTHDNVDFAVNSWDGDIIPFKQCLILIARYAPSLVFMLHLTMLTLKSTGTGTRSMPIYLVPYIPRKRISKHIFKTAQAGTRTPTSGTRSKILYIGMDGPHMRITIRHLTCSRI